MSTETKHIQEPMKKKEKEETKDRELMPRERVALHVALKFFDKIEAINSHSANNQATLAKSQINEILKPKDVPGGDSVYQTVERELFDKGLA